MGWYWGGIIEKWGWNYDKKVENKCLDNLLCLNIF